jgi:hypothetical protein
MRHEHHSTLALLSLRSVAGLRKTASAAALVLLAGLGGCKKDAPTEGGKVDPAPAEGPSAEASGDTAKKSTAPGGGGPTTADGLTPASQLQRGIVLGHVLIPNATVFLGEIKAQVAPKSTSMFLDEQMLRTIVSGQLGSRSNIAKNIDLAAPMGCAMVDLTVTDMPLACIVGYSGGVDAIVGDLGDDGKQADAAGHAAHYKLAGQEIYVDALDGHVVLTNHEEIFGKAKDYLQSNMLARADKVASDIETVAYLASVLTRYEKQLEPILDQITEAQSITVGGNRLSEAMAKYNAKSTQNMFDRWTEMEQITVGFGLEPAGFVLRYAVFPRDGSRLATESKAAAAGSLDASIVKQLPATAWTIAGASFDWTTFNNTESSKELRVVLGDAYAAAVGKDAPTVHAAIERYFDEAAALYANEVAYAVVHEPTTVGALMTSLRLVEGKKGREQWKAWTKEFTPENILDEESRKRLTWSFTFDAYTVGDVPVDRWTIEPTPAGHKELRAELGPQLAAVEEKLGGVRLVIDRAEFDGRVAYVVTPMAEEKSMTAVVQAAKGQGNLAGEPALADVLARSEGLSGLLAIDVARGANWMRDILPADSAARIPQNMGNALSDVSMATSYAQSGTQTGELVISQPFLDQLRALAE